ncbi:MAG: DUF4393 domain-containing protein [Solirubrobacteraceae bacterium]
MEGETEVHHELLDSIPGLIRLAAGSWLRTAQWTVGTSVHAGERLARAAVSADEAGALLADLRGAALDLLGAERPAPPMPSLADHDPDRSGPAPLRERGAELLRRSADIHYEEDAHPAYGRILEELAPDEARILRFLAAAGPQPSVDVRSSRTLNVSSQLVAPGLTMIGAKAGCRYMARVPAYLNNLFRLGLVWFSREPLEDPLDYQVLEAQPDVIDALRRGGGRGRTVRRSIHLTPFGEDFCQQCLPPETDGLRTALSGHNSLEPPAGGLPATTKEPEHG